MSKNDSTNNKSLPNNVSATDRVGGEKNGTINPSARKDEGRPAFNRKDCLLKILKSSILDLPLSLNAEEIDLKLLRDYAKFHEIEAMLYPVLKNCPELADKNGFDEIRKDHKVAIVRYMNQEHYKEQINAQLNAAGIKHIFLKGCVIRHLYPSPEMRQSSDIDVFFDKEYADDVKQRLCRMGFTNTKFGGYHDVYTLPPYMYVEMHRSLLPPRSKYYDLGLDIVERAVKKSEYEYAMTDEDFYLFQIIHTAKHMRDCGMGIRAFFDLWLYLRQYRDTLNWDFIDSELQRADLSDFEKHIRCLTLYWFENGEKDEFTDELERYVTNSGWNGTESQMRALKAESYVKDKKLLYYFKYLFKSADELKFAYPYLTKHPWMYPRALFNRIYKAVFVRKNAVKKFVHRYDNVNMSDIDYLQDFIKRIGL